MCNASGEAKMLRLSRNSTAPHPRKPLCCNGFRRSRFGDSRPQMPSRPLSVVHAWCTHKGISLGWLGVASCAAARLSVGPRRWPRIHGNVLRQESVNGRAVRVELLHVDDCPNWIVAESRLTEALSVTGHDHVPVERRRIGLLGGLQVSCQLVECHVPSDGAG